MQDRQNGKVTNETNRNNVKETWEQGSTSELHSVSTSAGTEQDPVGLGEIILPVSGVGAAAIVVGKMIKKENARASVPKGRKLVRM